MKNNPRLVLWSLLLTTATVGAAEEDAARRTLTAAVEKTQTVAVRASYVLLLRTSGA